MENKWDQIVRETRKPMPRSGQEKTSKDVRTIPEAF